MSLHKKQIFIRFILTLLTIGIVVFIFSQSMMPATESSAESGRVVKFLNSICTALGLGEIFTQGFVRTCAHFAEYTVLGLLIYFTVSSYSCKTKLILATSPILYTLIAFSDECIQLTADGRTFQFKDIIVDFLGGTLGASIGLIILLIYKRVSDKK